MNDYFEGYEEEKVVGRCHVCGGEIYEGNRYAEAPDGRLIHWDECVDEVWSDLSWGEKLELLGYEEAR